jgi:hypothetical protein
MKHSELRKIIREEIKNINHEKLLSFIEKEKEKNKKEFEVDFLTSELRYIEKLIKNNQLEDEKENNPEVKRLYNLLIKKAKIK